MIDVSLDMVQIHYSVLKVLENWLYWILINTISIFLFIERDLDQTAAMFSLYLLLSVLGYMTWLKNYAKQNQTSS